MRSEDDMAEAPRFPHARPYAMPRWVKIFLIIGIVLVLAVVVLLLFGPESFGPGGHGPSRH
jgi:hypothetical protein